MCNRKLFWVLFFVLGNASLVSAAPLGTEYLIIAHDDFFDPQDPDNPLISFKAHKEQRKNLSVKIIRLSEIPLQHPHDRVEDIRSYLRGARVWNPKPRYVLLVGDFEFIPARKRKVGGQWKDIDLEYEVVTDHCYANLDYFYLPDTDPFSEYVYNYPVGDFKNAEYLVGRFPVDGIDVLSVMVNKVVDYESSEEQPWHRNIMMTSMFDDNGHWDIFGNKISSTKNDAKEDSPFIETSQEVYSYLWFFANYMNIDRVYSYYSDGGLPSKLKGIWGLPLSKSAAALIADDNIHTKRQTIIDAINSGVLMYTYRGHGNIDWDPFDVYEHLDELNNADRLPVAVNAGCLMGAFQDYSLGERLLEKRDGGVVGFIGASVDTNSGYNDEFYKGVFKAIWPGFGVAGTTKLGEILFRAKVYMNDNYNYLKYSPMLYNLGIELIPNLVVAFTPSLWDSSQKKSGKEYMMAMQTEAYKLLGDPEMDLRIPSTSR